MTAPGRRLRPQVCRGHWEDHLPPLLVLVWSSAFQQHRTTVEEICKKQELSAMAKNETVAFSRARASFIFGKHSCPFKPSLSSHVLRAVAALTGHCYAIK